MMDNYENKLDRERRWHTEETFDREHVLNSRFLYDRERNLWNYEFPKRQMAELIRRKIRILGLDRSTILVAPVGDGQDIRFLEGLAEKVVGIDLSPVAVAKVPAGVEAHVGDMKRMTVFPDEHFPVVVTPLFFHHFRDDLDPFLAEIYRVLKPGGLFVALEPSILHPLSWITRSLRHVAGNITGQVEDEGPMMPLSLSRAMRRCGFSDIQIRGASFTHNRIPRPVGALINRLTSGLLGVPGVNQFAWMCLWSATRPKGT